MQQRVSRFLSRMVLPCLCLLAVHTAQAQSGVFTLQSPAFAENGIIDSKYAGKNPANANCTGEGVSPPLRWSNVPAGTNSLVLIVSDPQGALGLGANHWMAYGIPATQTELREGIGNGNTLRTGVNFSGQTGYMGPCPPKGSGMHHYIFLLIATDLAPDALPAGLTRAELDAALKGHAKGAAAWIGRFGNF